MREPAGDSAELLIWFKLGPLGETLGDCEQLVELAETYPNISSNGLIVKMLDSPNGATTIDYDLDDAGRIHCLDDAHTHNWRYGSVVEMCQMGYVKGNYKRFVVMTPELGANWGEALLYDLIIGVAGNVLWDLIKQLLKRLKIIKQERNKQHEQCLKELSERFLNQPSLLREFIDIRQRWSVNELRLRLGVSKRVISKILPKLGYSKDGRFYELNTWDEELTASRHYWIHEEEKEKLGTLVFDNE